MTSIRPATDFADHADAIEQSAADLVGVNLANLARARHPDRSSRRATSPRFRRRCWRSRCDPPTQCGFQPLLGPESAGPAPALASRSSDDFDSGNTWPAATLSHEAYGGLHRARLGRRRHLPDGRAGTALFAPKPDIGTCAPGGDETGVLHPDSPAILIPALRGGAEPDLRPLGRDRGRLRRRQRQDERQRRALHAHSDGELHLQRATTRLSRGRGQHRPARGQPAWSRAPTAGAVDGPGAGRSSI